MPFFNKKYIIICWALACVFSSPILAGESINRQHPDYVTCSHLIESDKGKALRHAESWLRRDSSITALHCKAISLFALDNYSESAQTLDKIYSMAAYDDIALRVSLKRQASASWQLAGNGDVALKRLDEAVDDIGNITDRNRYHLRYIVEILIKKAEIEDDNNPLIAIQHLDHAYSLGLLQNKVLIARSQVYALIKDYSSSIRDIREILRNNSRHSEAIRLQKIILIKQQK